MSKSAAGIIFSTSNNSTDSRLTRERTSAAIPFACRYRLVDFCLSNLVNANISNINVVVNSNHRSLIEHIGSGKDWDLARRDGGIRVITPYQTANSLTPRIFQGRMDALKSMKDYIDEYKEEYVILMDTDIVFNINLSELIKTHDSSGADITFVTKKQMNEQKKKNERMVISSKNGKIHNIVMSSNCNSDKTELSLNMFILKCSRLKAIIEEAEAYKLTSLTTYFIKNLQNENYMTYVYDGFAAELSDFEDYYSYSMELINNKSSRDSLLWKKDLPIFTKVNNSYPTVHTKYAEVKNSMIADECVIEGTVINSVLFRGVKVGRNAVIKNSVLFHGTEIKANAEVNCIVTDKNVVISEGVNLSGSDSIPFYIPKNKKV